MSKQNREPSISVIIPTLNEEHRLPLLLADLKKQSSPADEILVIDGGSSDATVEIAQKTQGTTLQKSEKSVGKQRTLGGQQARSEWLCFLDADVRIERDFLQKVRAEIAQTDAQILCPRYIPDTTSQMVSMLFRSLNWLFKVGARHYPAGAGCCIIVRRDLFDKIRGFNHHILCDDLDFVYRAGKTAPYQQLPLEALVSDRRFQEDGVWKTTGQYLLISWYFLRHQLSKTNQLDYPFGKHAL